jgi:hypothetical protein
MYNYLTSSVTILELYPFVEEYCRHPEKYKECARYKILIEGDAPPENLLPNGKMLKKR